MKSILMDMHRYADVGDFDAYYQHVTDDFVFHRAPLPDTVGIEANIQADKAMQEAFTESKTSVHEIVVDGDTAVTRYAWEAVHSGPTPSLGIPATGKRIEISGCMVYHWKNGKLVELWDHVDMLGLLKQLGAFPD
jgi:steroid delta-isomerase-like uncharacterized protein